MRYMEGTLHREGGGALSQVAQRSCGFPLPGSAQGQVGRDWEHPGLVEAVPAHGWNWMTLNIPSIPNHSMLYSSL